MQWLDGTHAQAFAWINDGPDLRPHMFLLQINVIHVWKKIVKTWYISLIYLQYTYIRHIRHQYQMDVHWNNKI